jgi:hypothetical protein
MKTILLALLLSIPALAQWPNGYTYRRSITIDHNKVPNTDQTNFPVLVCFNGATGTSCDGANSNTSLPGLKTVANSGKIQHTVTSTVPVSHTICADCIITDASSNLLPFELINYSATTGAAEFWVKIATLSHTADTTLYIYYGNASVTTDQSAPNSVWDTNYQTVMHMNDNAANTTVADSTSHSNGVNSVNTSTKSVTGQIFNGLSYLSASCNNTQISMNLGTTNQATVEWWMNWTTFASDDHLAWEYTANANSNTAFHVNPNNSNTALFGAFEHGNAGGVLVAYTRPSAGAWHHYVAVFDLTLSSHQAYLYIDGVLGGGATPLYVLDSHNTDASWTASSIMYLMSRAGSSLCADGSVEEWRLSKNVRSADWVATSYNNQSSPNTFFTLGPESTNGGGSTGRKYRVIN